jgi:hypothetical protein
VRIYVENRSTVLSDEDVLDAIPAFRRQTYHVREWWRSSVEALIFGPPPVEDAWQIVILDDSDQQGALAYHDFTPGGRPISSVFAKTEMDNGYSWTVSLSHELCEMIIDPWISAMMQTDERTAYALELCDPVEDDSLGYEIHVKGLKPVLVSDFITPNWLIPGSPGVYDHMGHCHEPLEVLDGGYAYLWQDNEWQSIDHLGKTMTPAEFAKRHPEKHRLQRYARMR